MALIWADPYEMYGREPSRMLDGIYAEISNNTYFQLRDSPDGDGTALWTRAFGTGTYTRYVLPSGRSKIGVGTYIYLPALPVQTTGVGYATPAITFRNNSNSSLWTLWVSATGQLVITTGAGTEGVEVSRSSGPVLTAAAMQHLEWWVEYLETSVKMEVRVRGKTVILKEDVVKPATMPYQIVWGIATQGGDSSEAYYKHTTIADGLGSVNNDFLGQVTVGWNPSIETLEDGGWVSSAQTDAAATLSKPRLANQLTATGALSSGNQVRIANTYYNWTSGSVNTGTPQGTSANPWLVAIGSNTAEGLKNMYEAIGGTGIPGTTYSTALTPHTSVNAFGLIEDAFCIVPKTVGTTSMTFSETGVNTAWTSTTTFLDRVWDPIRMEAGFESVGGVPVYPDPFEILLKQLPDDVTSVKAVIPIVRAAKIDGGDGDIQVSFGTLDTNYDDGPNTSITNAFTYWGNATEPFVSEINPDTGTPWTPAEWNLGARIKVNRTK